jgi:hypothetical protein
LRTLGITIDLISIGLFIIVSVLVSVKNLNHLSEFSGFGMKLKFNEELKKLSEKSEKIEKEIEMKEEEQGLGATDSPGFGMGDPFTEYSTPSQDEVTYLKPTFINPKVALIEITIEIENILKNISSKTLKHENKFSVSPNYIINKLSERKIISEELSELFIKFWSLRNSVIHDLNQKYSFSQILSLTETGLRILNILNSVYSNNKSGVEIVQLS